MIVPIPSHKFDRTGHAVQTGQKIFLMQPLLEFVFALIIERDEEHAILKVNM